MNKEELLKSLGENIKLDILLEYINHNEVLVKAHTKRLNYQKYAVESEAKINSIIHKSKFYLSEVLCAAIAYTITFLLLKFLVNIKSTLLLIVLVLIIGGNIGYLLNILSEKLAKKMEKDNLLQVEEELHQEKEVVESTKVVEKNFNEIIEIVRRKTHNNLDKIKLNYDGDIYLESIIYSYLLIDSNKCSNIRECEKYIQDNNLRSKNYNIDFKYLVDELKKYQKETNQILTYKELSLIFPTLIFIYTERLYELTKIEEQILLNKDKVKTIIKSNTLVKLEDFLSEDFDVSKNASAHIRVPLKLLS